MDTFIYSIYLSVVPLETVVIWYAPLMLGSFSLCPSILHAGHSTRHNRWWLCGEGHYTKRLYGATEDINGRLPRQLPFITTILLLVLKLKLAYWALFCEEHGVAYLSNPFFIRQYPFFFETVVNLTRIELCCYQLANVLQNPDRFRRSQTNRQQWLSSWHVCATRARHQYQSTWNYN